MSLLAGWLGRLASVSLSWLSEPVGRQVSLGWLGLLASWSLLAGFQVGVPDLLMFVGWWGILASWFLLLFRPSPLVAWLACWLGLLACWLVSVFLAQNRKVVHGREKQHLLLSLAWLCGCLGLWASWSLLVGWRLALRASWSTLASCLIDCMYSWLTGWPA